MQKNTTDSLIIYNSSLTKGGNSSQINFDQITGFACKDNKTLSFLAIDSLNYGLIAEKLGTPLKSAAQSTVAIIIDSHVCGYSFYSVLRRICIYSFEILFNFRMNRPIHLMIH